MANLRELGSRKRRRASTVVEPANIIADSDSDGGDSDAVMLETAGSESTTTNRSTPWPEAGAGMSVPSGDPSSTPESTPDPQVKPRTKFIVGLDYGTTFSSVSYIKFNPDDPPRYLRGEQIQSVVDWPGAGNRARNIPDVPSETWYLDGKLYWGYGARQAIKGIENDNLNYRNRIIQYAKLMVPAPDNRKDTRGPREELRRTLHRAQKEEKEAIQDYLREILRHTKTFLRDREEFNEASEVELVFCVPAGWPEKANRCMQDILLQVAQEAQFRITEPLFVLNEPEAAAACILEAYSESGSLKVGDVFMVCDAGGGTVDTITYRVRREIPFRVAEVETIAGPATPIKPLKERLREELQPRNTEITTKKYGSMWHGPSFEYVIEHDVMSNFEYELKRTFNPADGLEGDENVIVRGLQKSKPLRFGHSTMIFSRKEIAEFFQPSLDGISKLIHQQINAAKTKGLTVQRLLMVGGFSSSPALKNHIETEFPKLKIMYPPGKLDSAVSVSHGAVFRALNKSDGPKRIVQSNFGFLQIEEYNKRLRAHQEAVATFNETDEKSYVYNVLDWDQVLAKNHTIRTRNWQTFKMEEELTFNQKIWVSGFDNAQDHYQSSAMQNRGAEVLGILLIDLQEVKEEGLLETKMGGQGPYYEVHYELGMEVDGRNLSVKLFCPPGGRCRAQMQLCIAAAFIPGTE
ncbi:hypothetical protein BJX70DRAFT_395283 [Aspergillus crustosus]